MAVGVGGFAAIVPGCMWFLAGFEFTLFASPEPLGVAGAVILFFAVASTISITGVSSGESGPIATIAIFGVVPAVFVVGGVFPARALGTGWVRSVISSVVTVGACCLLVPVIGQDREYEFFGQSFDNSSVVCSCS